MFAAKLAHSRIAQYLWTYHMYNIYTRQTTEKNSSNDAGNSCGHKIFDVAVKQHHNFLATFRTDNFFTSKLQQTDVKH